jgi:hypothetical protein
VDSKTKSVMLGNKEVKLTVVRPTKCCVLASLIIHSFINLESIPLLANSIRPTPPARSGSGLSLPRTTVTLMRSSLFSISPTKVRGFHCCINFETRGESIQTFPLLHLYVICSPDSYTDVPAWVEEGQRYAVDSIMFLVGNKADVSEERVTEAAKAEVRSPSSSSSSSSCLACQPPSEL